MMTNLNQHMYLKESETYINAQCRRVARTWCPRCRCCLHSLSTSIQSKHQVLGRRVYQPLASYGHPLLIDPFQEHQLVSSAKRTTVRCTRFLSNALPKSTPGICPNVRPLLGQNICKRCREVQELDLLRHVVVSGFWFLISSKYSSCVRRMSWFT